LADGYRDRTQERIDEEEDDKAKRIKALEEQMKLGQIEESTFLQLRDAITGGDVSNTHLVKGLDFKLLERVRRGEDVLSAPPKEDEVEAGSPKDLDDEFEELEKHEVAPVVREKVEKKGEMAPPPPVAGQKRTRDQILAELKAQRKAAAAAKAEAAAPKLGMRFKKIGGPEEPRVERDARGREILITTDADGNIKRRVRKVRKEVEEDFAPDKDVAVLGADVTVPELPPPPPEDEDDDDIFEDAGHDFNPLDALGDEDSEDEAAEKPASIAKSPDEDGQIGERSRSRSTSQDADLSTPNQTQKPKPSTAPRNYFNDDPSTLSVLGNLKTDLQDPSVLAALANSRKLDPTKLSQESRGTLEADEARQKRLAAMISNQDRDMEDMDMGFGSSRFDDAEEMAMEGEKVKLSHWKGLTGGDDDDEEEGGDGAKKKRKRGGGGGGGKKRKGDKNDASDVLKVMERKKMG